MGRLLPKRRMCFLLKLVNRELKLNRKLLERSNKKSIQKEQIHWLTWLATNKSKESFEEVPNTMW